MKYIGINNYYKHLIKIFSILLCLFYVTPSQSACLSNMEVKKIAKGFPKNPVKSLQLEMTLQDAYCTQKKLNKIYQKAFGLPVGYKVGFTGKKTQERFQIKTPTTGVLYQDMFLTNGSTIEKNFGYRTFIEPDLMVIVKDTDIMKAKTEIQVLQHLISVHPYIELPALRFVKGEVITGHHVVALNMLATKMVMGPGIEIQATEKFLQKLADMETIFEDGDGNIIQIVKASSLMGNPIRVVLWLIKEFNKKGIQLKKGDKLSLGSVGKLFPLTEESTNKTFIYTLRGLNRESKASITIQ